LDEAAGYVQDRRLFRSVSRAFDQQTRKRGCCANGQIAGKDCDDDEPGADVHHDFFEPVPLPCLVLDTGLLARIRSMVAAFSFADKRLTIGSVR
jgi:hypothetical protein